ncbi:hypothetical protein Rsub_12526 [Raphidocelis subcapitata]|uniref:DJ-1/PfpI domain-containing protein n=1 Tax=Raphidocelis subcapitata TaxID=307507 RepID=A0A2V0PIX9_9CHLO|nr:hypothetical protein Rsub_12526 [Raphidocelis subcapitata]|eukprot:GBF99751.1 hypothetical protein Rsub_12526 [Raphidocelis subcapitata]
MLLVRASGVAAHSGLRDLLRPLPRGAACRAPPAAPAARRRSGAPAARRGVSAMAAAAKRVLVPIGSGTEEMEAVITIDVLRRAGADVVVASVEDSLEVTCSRGVRLVADALIGDAAAAQYDLIALPGGMPGAERLRDSTTLASLVGAQRDSGRLTAAICATPAVFLEPAGIIRGARATAHPAFSDRLANQSAVAQRVVVDGNLVTSRGPGTAFEFALELVKQLYGPDKAREVAGPMQL